LSEESQRRGNFIQVLSPDGERILSFHSELNGNEISFIREITVLDGGSRGMNGLDWRSHGARIRREARAVKLDDICADLRTRLLANRHHFATA
jgi:hypothetical protein